MAELAGEHDHLASVMALMCDEVRQDVRDVQRQIAPDVGLRWRHLASCSDAELEQRFNPFTAPIESGNQFMPRDLAAVDRCGDRDPVFLAESLEPGATRVVQMPGDHANRAPRSPGNLSVPEGSWQVLDEVGRNPAVGPPGSQKCVTHAFQPRPLMIAPAVAGCKPVPIDDVAVSSSVRAAHRRWQLLETPLRGAAVLVRNLDSNGASFPLPRRLEGPFDGDRSLAQRPGMFQGRCDRRQQVLRAYMVMKLGPFHHARRLIAHATE